MNKKMLIALGASVCLSTAAFAADTTVGGAADNAATAVKPAPEPVEKSSATQAENATLKPSKPANTADKAKPSDKKAEGKCAGGKCSAGNCSGASKK